LSGASKSLSKERDFLSKVIVTESIDVVPKRMHMATIPANTSMISKVFPALMNIISIQANGKIIPQLIFGGFR
jgi:hypothetical protein